MTAHWEHFPHEADVGVRGIGATPEQAFEQAALAMTAVIADPATITPPQAVAIEAEAPDVELLLVDWLNALVYEMATRKWLFSRFEVHLDGHRLTARAWGESMNRVKHQPTVEIKGGTYNSPKGGQTPKTEWVPQRGGGV